MQLHHARISPTPFQPFGFRAVYYPGTVNHCPGCGKTHWHVGRMSAQCAFCSTAIPFAQPNSRAA